MYRCFRFKAYGIQEAGHLGLYRRRLQPLFCARCLGEFDITNDDEAQKALLKSMTVSEIIALYEQMGADRSTLPRRPRKDKLITRFLRSLRGTPEEMDRAIMTGELQVGGHEVHVELGHNTTPEDIITQLIVSGVLPDRVPESCKLCLLRSLTMISLPSSLDLGA